MEIDKLEVYLKQGLITKIIETELPRYLQFFEHTVKENKEHAEAVKESFPRWSIISGYYAMHDAEDSLNCVAFSGNPLDREFWTKRRILCITKLFLAKQFSIKIELKVHKTAISLMKSLCNQKEILELLQTAYDEFLKMANDLAEAKTERVKAQYYTGSKFMKEKYKEKAEQFLKDTVDPYLLKMHSLLAGKGEAGVSG